MFSGLFRGGRRLAKLSNFSILGQFVFFVVFAPMRYVARSKALTLGRLATGLVTSEFEILNQLGAVASHRFFSTRSC